jgi:hypothetical protein
MYVLLTFPLLKVTVTFIISKRNHECGKYGRKVIHSTMRKNIEVGSETWA